MLRLVWKDGAVVDSRIVYTIGHGNQRLGDFLTLLKRHEIQTLVDVRSTPYSRFNPDFNRADLNGYLQDQDSEYIFAGEFLGGRPSAPEYYKAREVPTGKADYLNLVDHVAVAESEWFRRGLKRLLEISAMSKTVLMCSEENPFQCHRHQLIAPSLCRCGALVSHIRRDGKLQSVDPSAFRREGSGEALTMRLSLGGLGQ